MTKDIILAQGSATGHTHRITGTGVTFDAKTGELVLKKPVVLVHEEHKDVALPAGTMYVGIKREYDPFAEVIRKVQD